MKKASRFMPKYRPNRTGKVSLFVVLVIAVGVVVFQPWYLAVVTGFVLLIVIWSKINQSKIEKHFQKLCKEREGFSICEFSREFDPKVIDTWIIRAVYEQLQAALPTGQEVPIKASDNLFDILLLDEDDIDLDLVEEIAQRTNRSLEGYDKNPYYGKVTTAGSLVLFFNHQASANAT